MMGWDDNNGDGYGYGYYHQVNGVHIVMMIAMMVLVVLAVILIARAVHRSSSPRCENCGSAEKLSSVSGSNETARELLDRRFAQGKIGRKKYLAARDLLG